MSFRTIGRAFSPWFLKLLETWALPQAAIERAFSAYIAILLTLGPPILLCYCCGSAGGGVASLLSLFFE